MNSVDRSLWQALRGPIPLNKPYIPLPMMIIGSFLASFSLALLFHAPGGLGVLEVTFLQRYRSCRASMCWRR